MAESVRLVRTKPNAIDDADPTLGVFVPPAGEIFVIRGNATIGFRVALIFTGGTTFTATMTPNFRDAATGTWISGTPQSLTPNRRMLIQPDSGAFDVWIRLTAITGGFPIEVRMAEVFHSE